MRSKAMASLRVAVAACGLFSLAAAAMAETPTFAEIDWSLGGSVGPVWGATDPDDDQYDIDTADTLRFGGRLFGHLRPHRHFGLELGYVNLGAPNAELEVPASAVRADYEDAIPKSGHGLDLSLLGFWGITSRTELHARAGLWYWQSELQADGESTAIGGLDAVLGMGVGYEIDRHWSLRADVNRYQLEDQPAYFVGLGVVYNVNRPIRMSRPVSDPRPEQDAMLPQSEPVTAPTPAPIPESVVVEAEPEVAEPEMDHWSIYFDTASAEIGNVFNHMLDQAAAEAATVPEWVIRLDGNADSRGSAEMNQRLSEDRAQAVKAALVERGVAAERIMTTGYGFEQLVADESEVGGLARNRRVEIVLMQESDDSGPD